MAAGVLVIGYGNTLRGDDGIGPAVAAEVGRLGLPGVRVQIVHQLTPELSADLADASAAVFVDAGADAEPVRAVRLDPGSTAGPLFHAAEPQGLLTLAWEVYGRAPDAWLVTAAGADFGFHDGLSAAGRENARTARGCVERIIREAAGA